MSALSKRIAYAILAALAATFLSRYFTQVLPWNDVRVNFAIPDTDWKAVYARSIGACGAQATKFGECLANPAQRILWESPYDRSDPAAHRRRLIDRRFKEYWIGARVAPEILAAAAAANANQLVIGYVRGTHTLWVDGELVSPGTDREPLIVSLPFPRMSAEKKPLTVAIRIIADGVEESAPDILAPGFGTGFATEERTKSFRRRSRP